MTNPHNRSSMSFLEINMSKRRNAIVRGACTLLSSEGIDGLKIRDLASLAGLTAPTIYNLIGGKDAVLTAIIDEFVGRVSVIRETSWEGAADVSLCRRMDAYTGLLTTHTDLCRAALIAHAHAAADKPDEDERLSFFTRVQSIEICEIARRDGLIRGNINPAPLGEAIYDCFRVAQEDWAKGVLDAAGFRRKAMTGAFLCLAADANTDFRESLMQQIRAMA